MTKFKVGDPVRVKPEDREDFPGREGVVSHVSCESVRVTFPDWQDWGYCDFELELVSNATTSSQARKNKPLARGCLDYFPAALAAVAELSRIGNEKHNPGEDMHHARGKSSDHADCILRHLVDRGTIDADSGLSHSVAVAWRALALLQEELEAAGAPKARGAK